jgi:hypothetical protein
MNTAKFEVLMMAKITASILQTVSTLNMEATKCHYITFQYFIYTAQNI